MRIFLGSVLAATIVPEAQSAVLVAWDFSGNAGDEATVQSTFTDPLFTASSISRGSGVTPRPTANSFSSNDYTFNGFDPNDYVQVTINPNVWTEYSLTSLDFEYSGEGGWLAWEVRSSLDGFTASLGDGSGSMGIHSVPLDGSFASLTAPVTFRIYSYFNSFGPMGFTGAGNDIEFIGSAAVPEPSSFALVSSLALAGFALWRRTPSKVPERA